MVGRASVLFPLVFVFGCADADWGTATGTVTLDGETVPTADITFHSVGDGPTAYGKVIDGSFTMNTGQRAGVKVGKYSVTVSTTIVAKAGKTERAKLLSPPRYAAKETSGLQAEVKPGANTFKFAMHSQPQNGAGP